MAEIKLSLLKIMGYNLEIEKPSRTLLDKSVYQDADAGLKINGFLNARSSTKFRSPTENLIV